MVRERKRDVWRRRLLGSKDGPVAASSQADDSKSISSASEVAPAVLSPPRATTPDPATSKQVETLDTQQQEPETPNDVWAAAFRKFKESDGDLAKAYAKLLNPAHEEDATKFDVDFAESTVERLAKEREEKQWKVAFAGKSIHVRSQVEKMVKFLLWTDTVVKAAVSTQPHAALAWSAVSIFLPLMKAGTELHEAMLAGLEEVNRMLVFWRISESSIYPFRSHARQSFYDIFIDLHHRIIRYYAHAICHLSSTQLFRARENLVGWNGWEAETKSIKDLNQNCQDYLESAELRVIQDNMESQLNEIHNSRLALEDISRSLEEIRFQYEDKIEGKLLKSLHADFKGHKNANSERVQGTCQWVFQDERFHQWRDNKSSSLLLISAGPGYGKSVLSRALIDENLLQSPARAATSSVCYFFFKDGDEKRTRACDAVAAILHQLFAQDLTGNLIKKAKTSYHRAGAGLRESFDELCDILTSCVQSPDAGEVICILDAFDECAVSGREKIATYFNGFYNTCQNNSPSSSSLKVVITSRNWSDIESSFARLFDSEHPSKSSHINGDEALLKIGEEIELVIEENLATIAGHLPKGDQKYLRERMKDMENRTYLWLRLFFQIIKEKPWKYRKVSEIIGLLESLPSEVSDVYEKILQPFYEDNHTKLLFQLMLAAPRPLQVSEADEALTLLTTKTEQWKGPMELYRNRWGEDFQSVVQNWTGFLVVATTCSLGGYELSFLHQTTREFLLSPKPTPGSWKGRLSYPESHAAMLSACLRTLPFLQPRGFNSKINPDKECLWYKFSSLSSHVTNYWPMHYELQDKDGKEKTYSQALSHCNATQPTNVAWLDYNDAWVHWRHHTGLANESHGILSIAAFFGLSHLVEKAAQADAIDSNPARANTVSPLQAASWNGQLETVKALVRNNADIEHDALEIGSPIECAIENGRVEVVQFFLTCSPAPIIREEALESAARGSSGSQILELLLQRFPELQLQETLMETAANNSSNGSHVLKLMLHERPALLPSDRTIHLAVENESCHQDVLKTLLDRRADFNVTEKMVENACSRTNNPLEILHFLFMRNPDVKITDDALIMAAGHSFYGLDMLKFFFEKHPGMKIPQKAFCNAAANYHLSVEILSLLFEMGGGTQVTPDLISSALDNANRESLTLDFLARHDGFLVNQSSVETWFQAERKKDYVFSENIAHAMRMSGEDITISEAMMKKIASWEACEIECFLRDFGCDVVCFLTDGMYNKAYQACQASRESATNERSMYLRYNAMKFLIEDARVDIRMNGSEGHRLSKDEVMGKLEMWKKDLDELSAAYTDKIADEFGYIETRTVDSFIVG